MESPIEHKGRVVLVEGDRIDVEMTFMRRATR